MQLLGSKRLHTTFYHPIANGLIECFHCQLKASIKCSSNSTKWTDALPLVLLGIRTAVKDDLQCTTAELVYGTTLGLPGFSLVLPPLLMTPLLMLPDSRPV